ncbi:MAG: hypothetical protein A4E20_01455 [Nitrospira sp. SG-bin2]|nr:MAG: hypothetical protein A4E20_01455 [Nitrospira sp. SG-bin2]
MVAMMVTSLVATAASAALSIQGQTQQRKAAVAYQNLQVQANQEQMRENRELATKAYLDQAVQANQSLSETRISIAEQNFDTQRKSAEARAATITAAAEGGVNGVSLYGLLDDFHRQEAMFKSRNDANLLFKERQTAASITNAANTASGRIMQVKPYIPGPIAPVDYFGPALGVVNSGAKTVMTGIASAEAGSKKP